MTMKRAQLWTAAFFTGLLGVGSLAISETVGSAAGLDHLRNERLWSSGLGCLAFPARPGRVGTEYLIYRLDLATGTIKTKVSALEIGWNNES